MKKALVWTLSIIISIAAIYSAGWFYMAHKMHEKLVVFQTIEGPALGITLNGPLPSIRGFPFAPRFRYEGGLTYKGTFLHFDVLRYEGFPFPGAPISIKFLEGPIIKNSAEQALYEFDSIILEFVMPKSFPRSKSVVDIKQWQQEEEKIDLKHLSFFAKGLFVRGDGYIGLDENLQFLGLYNAEFIEGKAVAEQLVKKGIVSPLVAGLMESGLSAAIVTPENGDFSYAPVTIKLEDQQLYAGPLKILETPKMIWPET